MIASLFAQAAQELEPRLRLAKVNTEEAQDLAARFGIRSIPTLMIFRGGERVGQVLHRLLRAAGAALPVTDVVHRTRQALLGRPLG